jgi:hypothetical protein
MTNSRRFDEDQRDLRIERLLRAGMEDRARTIYGNAATDAVLAAQVERAAKNRPEESRT